MKKLVYTLMLLIGFATVSFAQEANEIAVTQGSEQLVKSKSSGEYTFVLNGKTEGDISGSADYYTHYFTVVFDEGSQKVSLKMVENDERARAVIVRFLVASGVRFAQVDGVNVPVSEFMTKYL